MSGLFSSPGKQAQQAGSQDMQYAEQMIAQAEQYQQQQEGQLRNAIAGLGPNPFFSAGSSMNPKAYAVNPKDVQTFHQKMPNKKAPKQYGTAPGTGKGNGMKDAMSANPLGGAGLGAGVAPHGLGPGVGAGYSMHGSPQLARPVAPGSPHAPPQNGGIKLLPGGGGQPIQRLQGNPFRQAVPQQGHGQWGPGSQWYANHVAPQMQGGPVMAGGPFSGGSLGPTGGMQMQGAPPMMPVQGNPFRQQNPQGPPPMPRPMPYQGQLQPRPSLPGSAGPRMGPMTF